MPRLCVWLVLIALAVAASASARTRPGRSPARRRASPGSRRTHRRAGRPLQHLHSHPELSFQEVETARRIAEELRKAGAEVTTGVGKHGVVGVLKNGPGPTVLVRTDLDALPVDRGDRPALRQQGETTDDDGQRRSA